MKLALLLGGLVVLVVGAHALVRGASSLARRLGMPPLLVGLTIVAMGTSAPEVAVSVHASLSGQADLAVGNVIGSNILNVLLALGLSALVLPLTVSSQLVRLDVPIMVGASALVWAVAGDGVISTGEGVVLLSGLVLYTAGLLFLAVRRRRIAAVPGVAVDAPARPQGAAVSILLVLAGFALLVLGAQWLVEGAVHVAQLFGVSELAIGLTVVAAGTSAPEVATALVASLRGERDLAVGGVVGSNLFNLLGVLGIASIVAPGGVGVAADALRFDLPVMAATAFLCLPVFLSGRRVSRGEGLILLVCFVSYEAVVLLRGGGHLSASELDWAARLFFVPLLAMGIGFGAAALLRRSRERRPGPVGD